MLLSKATLGLAKLASKDSSRYTLQAICIEKDCAIETDGTQLMMVTHGTQPADDQYPATPGFEPKVFSDGPMTETVLVSRDAALAALKAIPKRATIPILLNAALGADYKLYVNQLDSVQSFNYRTEGRFPNWRAVMPSKEPVAQICLDARKLKQLAEYFIEHGDERVPNVRITLYGETDAVRFDARTNEGNQDITALLMPVMMESSRYPKRPDQVRTEQIAAEADAQEAKVAAVEASEENVEAESDAEIPGTEQVADE